MRPIALGLALIASLALVGCGSEADPKPPYTTPAPVPGPTSPPAAGSTPPAQPGTEFTGTGVVEVQGPSIAMQGTHQLVENAKAVALLESRTVDLRAHEGKRVKLTGTSSTTIEGGFTIVDVRTIEVLR